MESLSLVEYGILGTVATMAIGGLVYMFKKYHVVQESRITEKDLYTKELLDNLDKQWNSNSSLKELVKHTSITDKGAILSALEMNSQQIMNKIHELKTKIDVAK